jgi:cytochrome c-type biogenesis protein CcsB
MKKIFAFFSSTRLMIILLLIFAVSIAVATFVERDYGTDTARKFIYNAKWFELLLALGVINIISVTLRKKLFRREKLTLLFFHLAFVVIIIGAAITRYSGKEGTMHIREGETTRTWYTTKTHVGIIVRDQNASLTRSYPVLFATGSRNKFERTIELAGHRIKLETVTFIPKAEQVIVPSDDGKPMIRLVTNRGDGREDLVFTQGQSLMTNRFVLAFVMADSLVPDSGSVYLFVKEGLPYFIAPFSVTTMSMADRTSDTLAAGIPHPFSPGLLHNMQGTAFIVKQFLPKGVIDARPSNSTTPDLPAAVKFKIKCDDMSKLLVVFGTKDDPGKFSFVTINGVDIGLNYGSMVKQLPFDLTLNDFIIKRYPGSESPSWFESDVTLNDPQKGKNFIYRIFMNHILKHRGYRFYQSSYDPDEHGTILSLNRDGAGSTTTYAGYLLMALGMFLSLLNRNSRFVSLLKAGTGSRPVTISGVILLFIVLSTRVVHADNVRPKNLPVIDQEHAAQFGQILVQDNGGRIEPINTLASEVLRKVSRKEQYKGQSPDQVFLGMLLYPEAWQHEPMIRAGHPEIQKLLQIHSKYAAFTDFFSKDRDGGYLLRSQVEEAYRKKPAYRTKFDNEIIRADERLNICYLVYSGTVLKIFPAPHDSAHTWYSPVSTEPVFTGEDSVFTRHIIQYYAEEVQKSMENGDWKLPAEMIQAIKTFQQNYGVGVLPSTFHVRAETFYNKTDILPRLANIYLLVGLLLLLIQFIHIFLPRFNIRWFIVPGFIIIALTFLAHAFSLGLRWYISGHAPWSNGYEALTFIAWATMLAGIIFTRKASVALSSTAVLAALILQTAHLSWMDPQITNLVPVLKSYWLVVHVAVITTSYGFLGLGALVAAINLLLMFLQTERSYQRVGEQIQQISRVVEMTLIAGLYLLAIGTFLGGVWANESWGRYWAWDPKETWALTTVIVYAIILHLRLVPGLKGRVLFNILALAGFSSVIMTYFGVNYYLSGLHSYAKGDAMPVPPIVYYSVISVIILSLLAAYNQYRLGKAKELRK